MVAGEYHAVQGLTRNNDCAIPTWASAPAATESALAAVARFEIIDDVELCLHDRNDDELRDAIERIDRVRHTAAIPATHHQRPLIVGIDQADEIAEHDTVLVPEAGARKDHRCKPGIRNVDRDAGRDELRLTRRKRNRRVDARSQVHAGRARGRVSGQVRPDALVEDLEVDGGGGRGHFAPKAYVTHREDWLDASINLQFLSNTTRPSRDLSQSRRILASNPGPM